MHGAGEVRTRIHSHIRVRPRESQARAEGDDGRIGIQRGVRASHLVDL